jgi:MtfA peptidase
MVARLVVLFFVLGFVATPVILFYQIIRAILRFQFGEWWNTKLYFTTIDPLYRKFLEENFHYYQNLDDADKITFVRRVQKFIKLKEFEGREGLFVTEEMEVLVAASAVLITFGHPQIYFKHFDRIILYPDVYYSRITEKYHQGEVNSAGIIVLSYKNLLEGYMNATDGRNLGLHEMAHALKITDTMVSEEYDFLDRTAFHQFIWHARHEMNFIASGGESLFRKYAATNDHEFFAVAVENFFERPKEFYDFHPHLYGTLAKLMNQNPAGIKLEDQA